MSAKEHATELFVKRIAEPKFLGRLRQALGKETARMVAEELPKDLSWLNTREIEARYLTERRI